MDKMVDHYESLLAPHYSWLMGGADENMERNRLFFKNNHLTPKKGGRAVDLGAGSGFQSIPLAGLGYKVTAVDLSSSLLAELKKHGEGMQISTVQTDLLNFPKYLDESAELIVCMGDTLAHPASKDMIAALFTAVKDNLEQDGKFVLTFRDQSRELTGADRFLPVRSEPDRIFTCFVEYHTETIMVHDLVYLLENGKWQLHASSYPKLRLTASEIVEMLDTAGFKIIDSQLERGLATIIAAA